MTQKSLGRSKLGTLVAHFIELEHRDPPVQERNTADLIHLLEVILYNFAVPIFSFVAREQQAEPAAVLRAAKAGDRLELIEYLASPEKPITSEMRLQIIQILKGEKRGAHRHKVAATERRREEIATFVIECMYAREPYMKAVARAQKKFRCSSKTVTNACDDYGEGAAAGEYITRAFVGQLDLITDEILRRGEPEHCERVRELREHRRALFERPPIDFERYRITK